MYKMPRIAEIADAIKRELAADPRAAAGSFPPAVFAGRYRPLVGGLSYMGEQADV